MLELQRSLEILKIEFCMDLLRMKTLHRFLKTMSLLTFLQSQRRLQNRFLLDLRSLKLLRRKSILQEKVSDLWHIEHLCCSSVLQIWPLLILCISTHCNGSKFCSKMLYKTQTHLMMYKREFKILITTSHYHYIKMFADLYLRNINCYSHSY